MYLFSYYVMLGDSGRYSDYVMGSIPDESWFDARH